MVKSGGRQRTACAWVDRFVIIIRIQAFVRCAQSCGEVFAGAAAGIDISACQQPVKCVFVNGLSLTLEVGCVGSAAVRAFIPVHAEPMEIFERGVGVFGATAIWIEVFHAHDERAVCSACALPCNEESAGVADVKMAGGRRREPAAVSGCGLRRGRHVPQCIALPGWTEIPVHGRTSITDPGRRARLQTTPALSPCPNRHACDELKARK